MFLADFRSQTLQVTEALCQPSVKSTNIFLSTENKGRNRTEGEKERERESKRGREGPKSKETSLQRTRTHAEKSFPGGCPSGRVYVMRLHKEDKMSTSVLLRTDSSVWCQIKCSLDNNLYCSSEWILVKKLKKN